MKRAPLVVRVYGALARFGPPDLGRDREEMGATFGALWREADGIGERARLAVRSYAALAVVLVLEWFEYVGARGAPGRERRKGRHGMGLWSHVRCALRTLRKAPSFALTSVLLVGVGVGAVTTIFTLVDHVLLRPLPYPDADRLVALDEGSFQGPYFRRLEGLQTVDEWAGAWEQRVNLTGEGDPLRLNQARVTERFFSMFGARSERGRLLDAADFAAADAVVLDAGAWRRIFGADPSVVGRTVRIDGQPVVVVGVMDPRFAPPEVLVGRQVDLWRPLDWSVEELNRENTYVLEVAGHMRPGVAVPAVQAEVDALTARLAETIENYRNRRDDTPREVPVLSLSDKTVQSVRMGLGLLLGAVGLLLLVACANVAHLFLARGLGRTREMAVRRAMGAGTGSLVSQLMVESLVVGVTGGLLGCALAWAGIRTFIALNPTALPRQAAVVLDPRVLGFAIAVSALTSLLFGLLPALRSVKGDLSDELRGAGRTATSGRGTALLRNALVTAEVALSLVLVAGAALLLRSFLAVQSQDPGFEVAGVWTVPLNLTDADTPAKYLETMERIRRQAETVPGVASVAYGLTMPMDRTGGSRCCWGSGLKVPGRADDDRALSGMFHPVSLEYFHMLGIGMVAGRTWAAGEVLAEPVPLVLNEAMAVEIAGSANAAIGMSVGYQDRAAIVVGVAGEERHYGLDQETGKAVYLPVERVPFALPIASLGVRASAAAAASMPRALRVAVWAAAPSLPVTSVQPMAETIRQSTAGRRFDSLIFGAFAAVALLLAAGGLYGTLLYVAGQRKRELGIRLALGASRARIEGQVLRGGIALGMAGVVIGLAGSWLSNRFLESRVWGVAPRDPVALGGAAAVLLLTAVIASWLPARRAGRVDPLETLRIE